MKKILALGGVALVAVLVFVFMNTNQNSDIVTQIPTNNNSQETSQTLENQLPNDTNPVDNLLGIITSDLTAETAIASETEVIYSDFTEEENEVSNINSFYDPNNF